MKFTADQFTPTKWDTASDKAWFANHFMRFVADGFPLQLFTERFYRRLSNTFGHIAHYDQRGFWETFFATTPDKVRFLEITLQYPCYGDPKWTYSDVERALQDCLRKANLLERYRQQREADTELAERTEYERLRAKFG